MRGSLCRALGSIFDGRKGNQGQPHGNNRADRRNEARTALRVFEALHGFLENAAGRAHSRASRRTSEATSSIPAATSVLGATNVSCVRRTSSEKLAKR